MAKDRNLPAPRMDMPSDVYRFGVDQAQWDILTSMIFPGAKTPESIVMALQYCKVRGLDIFKRPVHIVTMWNSSLGCEVETIWPGINELITTAHRTGQFAGIDPPVNGPPIERTFVGERKEYDQNGRYQWVEKSITMTFHEWTEITAYRLVGGVRCPFTERAIFMEAYSTVSRRSELPTDMWVRRPNSQLSKCAKAMALRLAFPEEVSDYAAEEMEGKVIESGGIPVRPENVMLDNKPPEDVKTDYRITYDPGLIAPEFKEKIVELVERAKNANAWSAAEQWITNSIKAPENRQYAYDELNRAQQAVAV